MQNILLMGTSPVKPYLDSEVIIYPIRTVFLNGKGVKIKAGTGSYYLNIEGHM